MKAIKSKLNKLLNPYKATQENEGEKWAILWNLQEVKDFKEPKIWREGVIEGVTKYGFILRFPYGGYTVCTDLRDMKKL